MLAVGDVIAERAFYVDGETEPALIFRLSRPYQTEGDYPYCRREFISGTSSEEKNVYGDEKKVYGMDGVDCILTSFRVAGSTVAGLNESVFGGLVALGGVSRGESRSGLTDH